MIRHLAYGVFLSVPLSLACNETNIDPGNNCPGCTDGVDMSAGTGLMADRTDKVGPGSGSPFDPGDDGSSGVKLDPNGNIVLPPGLSQMMLPYVWVAGSEAGTVSKIETRSFKEVARYYTYPGSGQGGVTADPSRTTVGLSGDVVVANRAWQFGADHGAASAVKIAGDPGNCVDRNGNHVIDTSHDSTPLPWPAGAAESPDECVLWLTKLPVTPGRPLQEEGMGTRPRAAGFDATIGNDGNISSNIYVGLWNTRELVRLDSQTGAIKKRIDVNPAQPYGLVLDKGGNVWIRGAEGSLAKVDVRGGDQVTVYNGALAPPCPYGIAADANGMIYTAGGGNEQSCVSRFDPVNKKWEVLSLSQGGKTTFPRGLAVDQNNHVWVSDTHQGMFHVDASGPRMAFKKLIGIGADRGVDDPNVIGAAVDFDGKAWAVSYGNSKVYRIDPKTDAVDGSAEVGRHPYMYSDFTGFQLRNAGSEQGIWRHTFPGCGADTRWVLLNFTVTTPASTQVVIKVRSAATRDALAMAPFTQIAKVPPDKAPVPIFLPKGSRPEFLQVEFDLTSTDPKITPILSGVSVGYNCGSLG